MIIKFKRLLCKPCNGRGNLLSFTLVILVVYLFIRTYIFNGVDNAGNLPQMQLPNGEGQLIGDVAARKIEIVFDKECIIDETCSSDTIPYTIESGEGMDKYPLICFNGKLIVGKSVPHNKIGRGINLILVKAKNNTYEVDKIENFDTYAEDAAFFRFMKAGVDDGDVILIASYDEMANGLRDMTGTLMENYGSQLFKNIKFRDSFVMIGQRGTSRGKAIEIVEPKGKRDFAPKAKIDGCLKLPMGPITPLPREDLQVNSKNQIYIGNTLKHCGLPEPCPKNEFAVHIYSGANEKDEPKICIDGKYIMAKGLNDAGRGLNIVVIGNGKEILKTAHFDTYQEDSTNLEIFLENLYDNVIVIMVTFDEASSKLKPYGRSLIKSYGSQFIENIKFRDGWYMVAMPVNNTSTGGGNTTLGSLAKNLLYDLGSALVQNLRYRDAWYFVGQKSINGFSSLEEISYAPPDNAFPKPLDKRFCVPQTLKGMKIRPDPMPNSNERKRDFCTRYDGYGEFCFEHNIDTLIKPAPIINRTLEDHPIYSTPILIIGGLSHNSLRMTLETIIMQPGINPEMVYVAIDEKLDETSALVQLFEFNIIKTSSSSSYMEQMNKAMQDLLSEPNLKDKQAVIVIEEELLVSPDFLYLFTQVYGIFMADANLAAVSSWNPNGYAELDGSPHLVYRTNEFPGMGFLLKTSVYDAYMKKDFEICCAERAWNRWALEDPSLETLVPDVSRVYHRPYNGMHKDAIYRENLFNRARKTNLLPFPELKNIASLKSKEIYMQSIVDQLKVSIEFPNIQSCFQNSTIEYPIVKENYFKIIYEQSTLYDYKNLNQLCICFKLFYTEEYNPKGLLDGLLRFNALRNNYILIGSMNPLLRQLNTGV